MDIGKLVKIADELQSTKIKGAKKKPSTVTVSGLSVKDHRSPLEELEVREKIKDNTATKRVTKPTQVVKTQVKYVILDDKKIKNVMNMSRSDRREFMALLTDSERRAFLSRYQQIRDNANAERVNSSEVYNYLVNFMQHNSPYNRNKLVSILEEIPEGKIKEFVKNVLDGADTFEVLEEIVTEFDNQGVKVSVDDFGPHEEVIEDSALKEELNFLRKRLIMDEVIDKFADLEIDEEEIEVVSSPLQKLNEALNEYILGNEEPLKELATPELTEDESEENPEDEPEPEEEPEENPEEESEEGLEPEDEEVQDCVSIANYILNKDVRINKLVDKYQCKISVFQKYNFKIKDCDYVATASYVEAQPVVPPMDYDEFHSLYSDPKWVASLAKEQSKECLPVYSIEQEGDLLVTNKESYPQVWYPITGSAEEFMSGLNSFEGNISEWINDNCVSIDTYLQTAAKTNNLAIIDKNFYKKKFSDHCWYTKECPEFLKNMGIEKPCVKVYPTWANTMSQNSIPVEIFGVPFEVEV